MDRFSSRKKVDDIFKEEKGRHVIPPCNQKRKYVEVFSAQGKDPTENWSFRKLTAMSETHSSEEKGQRGMVRVYAPEIKGYYVRLTQQGSFPKAPLQLSLLQPYVVFQTFVPSDSNGFRVRLEVSTESGKEVTLFLSSGLKSALLTNPQRKCLPLPVQSDVWLSIVVDLGDLLDGLFPGEQFQSLQGIELEASCRIRRVFTVASRPSADDFVPRIAESGGSAVIVQRVRDSAETWSAHTVSDNTQEDGLDLPLHLLFPSSCVSSTMIVDAGSEGMGVLGKARSQRPGGVRISDSWVELPSHVSGGDSAGSSSAGSIILGDSDEDSLARGGMYDGEPLATSVPGGADANKLHFDNVRLYAAKRRSDSKLRVLEEQYRLLKGGFLPELDEAIDQGSRAAERAARLELELQRSRSDLREQRQAARGLETELEEERGRNIEQRIQIRNLQGLLLRSKGQAKGLLRQLASLSEAQAPLQEELAQQRRALEKERRQVLQDCEDKVAGFGELETRCADQAAHIAQMSARLANIDGGVEAEQQLRVTMLAEHSGKARAWAAEVAGLQSAVRLRDAQVQDLTERLQNAQGEARSLQATGQLFENQSREMETLRTSAGKAEREAEVLRAEIRRLQKSLSVSKREKEMEVERKEREQAVTLAKLQLQHDQTLHALRERVRKADQTVRIQHLRLHQGSVGGGSVSEAPYALDQSQDS